MALMPMIRTRLASPDSVCSSPGLGGGTKKRDRKKVKQCATQYATITTDLVVDDRSPSDWIYFALYTYIHIIHIYILACFIVVHTSLSYLYTRTTIDLYYCLRQASRNCRSVEGNESIFIDIILKISASRYRIHVSGIWT